MREPIKRRIKMIQKAFDKAGYTYRTYKATIYVYENKQKIVWVKVYFHEMYWREDISAQKLVESELANKVVKTVDEVEWELTVEADNACSECDAMCSERRHDGSYYCE